MRPLVFVAALLVFASCASAQAPKPERQSGGANTQPASDPRGTNESPLIVKVQPTPKTNEEAANEQAEEQSETASKRLTERLAILTGIVGLLQLIGLGAQVLIARRQNKIIDGQTAILKEQETSMKDGLRIARDSADASTKAAEAAQASVNIANESLLLTHRSTLAIRHIVTEGLNEYGVVGETLSGHAWITNIGPMPITLLRFYAEWLFTTHLPTENPVLRKIEGGVSPRTIGGAGMEKVPLPIRNISVQEHSALNNATVRGGRGYGDAEGELFLIGYVKYSDGIGLRRKFFCRQYDTSLRRFTEVDHPSYNYED
jgi:hypothetical protein